MSELSPHHPRLVAVFLDKRFEKLYAASTLAVAQAFQKGALAGAAFVGGGLTAFVLPDEAPQLDAIPVDQRDLLLEASPEPVDLAQTTSRPPTSDLPAHLEMLTKGRRTR